MDIRLIETGQGGDIVINQSVIDGVDGYENMPYLAMFGGADFWGNFLFEQIPGGRVESKTEKALQDNALNSSGLRRIEDAVKEDLAFLEDNIPNTTITVKTGIKYAREWQCLVTINGKEFAMNFNPTTNHLTYTS